MIPWSVEVTVLTGLVIFLYGIDQFSKEVQASAGGQFRKIILSFAGNKWKSAFIGTIVTAVIQSSTATTIITVSLVSAGIISFAQSLGLILGANIGTTLTAQLVALNLTSLAPLFITIGFLVGVFGKSYKYIGKGLFYLGLIFFGLELVSLAMEPIKNDPAVLDMFSKLSNWYVALLAGFIFTAIVQASGVTTGLVVLLASNGLITLSQAIPIILGANIGTPITTILAALRLNLYAKRAAAAHVLFNAFSVILMLPFLVPFTHLIERVGGSTAQQVANAHTFFNVIWVIIFLLFLKPYKRIIEAIVPGNEEEIILAPKHLPATLPPSNAASFKLIEKELAYALEVVSKLFERSLHYLNHPSDSGNQIIIKLESLSDLLDVKVQEALMAVSHRKLTTNEGNKVMILVRMSNAIEQLGDIGDDISRLPQAMNISKVSVSEAATKNIHMIYEGFKAELAFLRQHFPRNVRTARTSQHAALERMIERGYVQHVERMKSRKALGGSLFVESVSLMQAANATARELVQLSRKYSSLCA